jgi:hypothetical protein
MKLIEVLCDEHQQEMKHRMATLDWACTAEGCKKTLPDEEVHRLLSASAKPVPQIWVT